MALAAMVLTLSGSAAAETVDRPQQQAQRGTVELWFWGYGSYGAAAGAGGAGAGAGANAAGAAAAAGGAVPPPVCTTRLLGCFNDSAWDNKPIAGARVLAYATKTTAASHRDCAATCCAAGFVVAGVEFGGQCFCDHGFSAATSHTHQLNTTACASKPCTGNATEDCGGACTIVVFEAVCPAGACVAPPPPPPKPLVPPGILAMMTGNGSAPPAATGIIGGCGHALHDNGTFGIPDSPWLKQQVGIAHGANLTFTPLIAGCTLVQLRSLVFAPAKVTAFVDAFVADAMANDYDGFNFDWEMGGFNDTDAAAYAALVVQLQPKLTAARGPNRPIAPVSACVGDAKNGLASPAGVQSAPTGQALLYDMGTYSSKALGFLEELHSGMELIKAPHLVVGLSASTDSWKAGAPSAADLHERFAALKSKGLRKIALFGAASQIK